MHASHSESSKKYTTGYTNCLPIKYRQNNLYAIAVANHYTGFLEINLSAEIKTGATTHGAGFTNIEAGFMKQVLYLPVVCGEINLSSRLDIQFYRLQHVFRT